MRINMRFGNISVAALIGASVIGCNPNNNQNINTALAKINFDGSVTAVPLGEQPVVATWQSDNAGATGSTYSFSGVTIPYTPQIGAMYSLLGQTWPTYVSSVNDRMPAQWEVQWSHPPFCVSQTSPYGLLANPWVTYPNFAPTGNNSPVYNLVCYTNSVLNPGFVPTNISPQFALDDRLPSALQVTTILPVTATPSITNLHVFGTDLTDWADVSATSVANNGSSATFPYPRQQNGASLPAGAYITSMTTDPSGGPQTTNAMEPFYVGHDDTSFPGAYGVAIASPRENIVYSQGTLSQRQTCSSYQKTTSTVGGTPIPLVTLLTQGLLAIGTSSNTVAVGTNPTVVLPFNSQKQTTYYNDPDDCVMQVTTYTGAESALVVNTGSNNVSIVQIGNYTYPSGTVSVGNQPVAAVINSAQTFAYIANFGDGTISEVDLVGLQQTRTIGVMAHPSSVTFDTNGNLWVGGQGSIINVNVGSWSIASNTPIDGTVNGMSYDEPSGLLIETLLQNGAWSNPGGTGGRPIAFSTQPQASYTTGATYNVASGISTVTAQASDNAAYSQSALVAYLAYPAQTAISPPIYSSSSGDITATVSGSMFTISVIGTNQVLLQGVLPYPARGVALGSNIVYFTMPDSNSLVSLPIQIP